MKLRSGLYLSALLLASSGAYAQSAPQGAAPANSATTAGKPALDPNEVICERQEQLGSRLSGKRICMTRSQWADQKIQDRQATEKAQTQLGAAPPK